MADRGGLDLAGALVRGEKDDYIARLHREAPLYKDPNGHWIVSRFEDVRAMLLDHEHFSSDALAGAGERLARIPLITDDPPRHSHLRSLLARAFTPTAIEALRPRVDEIAAALTAQIPDGSETNVVTAITKTAPVATFASLLAIPDARFGDFRRWCDVVVGLVSGASAPVRVAATIEMRACLKALAASRRNTPGADLISALTKVTDEGAPLDDDQIVVFCVVLMNAGIETTSNLLGNLLHRLSAAPRLWASLRADPQAIDEAIEESLRLDSPAQMVIRRVLTDTVFAGEAMKAGDMVMVYLAAANRDPGKWQAPENYALARERERHLAFGHGIHTCIGAPLARMQAGAVMRALTFRFAGVAPGASAPIGLGQPFGLKALPLIFRERP